MLLNKLYFSWPTAVVPFLYAGARRMGLITGDSEKSTVAPAASGTGLMGKLASATSLFSRKKTPVPVPAAVPAPAAPAPSAIRAPSVPAVPAAASNSTQSSRSALPPPPPADAEEEKPETPTPTKTETNKEAPSPQEPATATVQPATPPEAPGAEEGPLALPAPAVVTPAAQPPAETETEEPAATGRSHSEEKVEVDVEADRTDSTPAAPLESESANTALSTSTSTADPDTAAAAEAVLPELKVVPFEVREPSLGAAVVGHVAILEGSCYVWAGTDGSAAQGSLAAAVGTRFDGGMPTATPLLAGEGAGEAGAAGGVGVSMAQRLCRRTGRVVFVSCDLSEDSQILVAAVEAKVLALLKAGD